MFKAGMVSRKNDFKHNMSVVKIQGEKQDSFTQNEKNSVNIFLKDGPDEVQINTTSFVQNTLQAVQLKKVASKYNSTKHVSPTSNLCERF